MTISNEAVEKAAKALFEANYANGAWGLVRGNDKKHYVHRARAALEAAAPIIRAEAIEDAADAGWQAMLDHARRTSSVPGADDLRDYLRARAVAERGRE